MGSSMGKCPYDNDLHCRRRRKTEVREHFSKKYSEYWRSSSMKKYSDNFIIERNNYSFSTSAIYGPPSRENRGASQFVSSFAKKDKSSTPKAITFTSGFDTGQQQTK